MKIVNYIKNSLIDFPKHIASVAFTYGCNWNCWYCQNHQLLNRQVDKTQEFLDFLDSRKGWIDGVVICGGEPTINKDLPQFIQILKDKGFDVKLDTNGTNPSMLAELIEKHLVDYIAMDVKAPKNKLQLVAGSSTGLSEVGKSIQLLKNSNIEYEFRTTVVPEIDERDILDLANVLSGCKVWILQQYVPPQFLQNAPKPLNYEKIQSYVNIAKRKGINCELR